MVAMTSFLLKEVCSMFKTFHGRVHTIAPVYDFKADVSWHVAVKIILEVVWKMTV